MDDRDKKTPSRQPNSSVPRGETPLDIFVELIDEPAVTDSTEDGPNPQDDFTTEILDPAETSLIDIDDDEPDIEKIELDMVDDEPTDAAWSDDGSDEDQAPESDWIFDEDEMVFESDDQPIDGELRDIHTDELTAPELEGLTSLDDGDDPSEAHIGDLMAELDIELAADEVELDSLPSIDMPSDVECQFLGPMGILVTSAVVRDAEPIAVGDGFFKMGADGLLHGIQPAASLVDLSATSVCANDRAIFIGTQADGVIVTRDFGQSFTPLNQWHSLGFESAGPSSGAAISIPVYVNGQMVGSTYRLLGRTGNGQLFFSADDGFSWTEASNQYPYAAVCPVAGTGEVIALVRDASNHLLLKSHDLFEWSPLALPTDIAQLVTQNRVSLAASSETIAIGVDNRLGPLHISLTGGKTWTPISALSGITSIALDEENPGTVAVAIHEPRRKLGMVRVSQDGGLTWRTILVTGENATSGGWEVPTHRSADGRIHELIIDPGHKRRFIAVTTDGIFQVTLNERDRSH